MAEFNVQDLKPNAKAWFFLLPLFWVVLLVGWAYLVGSILFGFEVPASGAILACCALIADLRLRSVSWGKLRTFSLITHFELRTTDQGKQFLYTDGFKMPANAAAVSLLNLADPNEEFWRGEEACWRASKTAHRVTEKLYLFVLLSAIVGTLVWGFAHLYFQ